MKSGCEGAAMEEGGCGGGLALMRLVACFYSRGKSIEIGGSSGWFLEKS
ncbi:hypothetical protein [Bartonella rattaustraliani]|nr:hypothetical protein [Bartonella rattaustraliani]